MEVGKITHSHSQPGGMDRTPPGTPKKGGKMLAVRVQMLDDSITMFQVQAKALGRVLFDQVCNQLHLLESDYFGLEYQETGGTKYWLDLEKPLSRQIGLSLVDTLVRFCVKFYTPDPSQLEEEFTRYLFCLQIKRDLSQGLLQCNNNTAALMASYIVQAECGDYVVEDYPDHRYLSSYKFVPNQDQELERRIMENHKKHAGQSPAEADLNLLETARRCELYGIKMHPAKDHEGVPLNLAVAHMGIVVFQNFLKINTFSWAKMRKISFKRKKFLVKLHPEGYGYYKDTVEFFFEGRNECKNFWKKCVENHGFFRCTMVKKVPRQKTRVLSRGSSFRYSGRTQKQIVDFVRENYVKRQTFQRSQSFRHSSSAHSSVANVGTSISAHPLLPLGDNAVAGTPASLSCGSMTLTSSPVHTADIHAGGSPSPPLTTSVSPGTSVTSSPQHFYPQETPYRRAGHQPTKVKHPHVRSHRAISPLHSPTDAVVAASNRSANHSNSNHANNGINNVHGVENSINSNNINNGNVGRNDDGRDSRSSLHSPEFTDFNEVYSNCYAFLRDSRKGGANEVVGERGTKNEGFDSSSNFANATSKSNESIRSSGTRTVVCGEKEDADRYTWHRSASCRDLYHEENLGEERNGKSGGEVPVGLPPEPSSLKQCDRVRRKCYSAVASKNPSVERTGDLGNEVRIYPSSYPGTTSSLSTESADGELDERIMEALDAKYDSQEEMVLSHDDVSHDSYELLERELDEYNGDGTRNKSDGLVGESERRRSCSWGSDRAIASLDFRSTENVLGAGCVLPGEESFWSLERERSSKHKSEIDFRSFSHGGSRGGKRTVRAENRWRTEGRDSGRPEIFDREGRIFKRNWEEDGFKAGNRTGRGFRSRNAGDAVEFCGALGQEFRPEGEDFESFERKRYSGRRKSLEELAMFPMELEEVFMGKPMRVEERRRGERRREKRERDERFHEGLNEKEQKDWMRGMERRAADRRKSLEEKQAWEEEEVGRKIVQTPNDYANFQEIHFKKFDRVVSNQFGKYSEFLSQENAQDFLAEEEKKVIENYEKVCVVSKMAKELKRNETGFLISENSSENGWRKSLREAEEVRSSPELEDPEECEERIIDRLSLALSPKASFKSGKAIVERTKSDPYNSIKNQRRSLLTHQKSIDLTPQQSEETVSDYDNEDAFKKTSRSEHDIPYILHKRHCMNGTARVADFVVTKKDLKMAFGEKPLKSVPKEGKVGRKPSGETSFKVGSEEVVATKSKPSSVRVADAKKAGVKIINLDVRHGKAQVNVNESKKAGRIGKPPATKKPSPAENKPASPKRVARKVESTDMGKRTKDEAGENRKGSEGVSEAEESSKEPIYAEVCREKFVEGEELSKPEKTTPPEPPKRTTSVAPKSPSENKITGEKKVVKSPGYLGDLPEVDEEKKAATPPKVKKASEVPKVKQDLPPVLQRREESLILFARTRLGLSEGSAFAPIVRQGRVGSPATQRRTKSLDSPYVSVHSLPPADAFSSKDDTVDETEDDVVGSAVARIKELTKTDSKPTTVSLERKPQNEVSLEPPASTESELDSVFAEDLEIDNNFKKTVENQSKVEISLTEEKVLDGVRNKRLLSKIESVDFIDSEGDLDSSKQTESVPIPSDRLVNLPESIRFPSVRQISGQTSEESADGWDQKEVKVKRRTPRRSVGREDQDVGTKESVVWDSKDDEPPDDDVWDDGLVQPRKYEGSVVNVGLPVEYLKRGSCGQSIDDDNLSTPMKESSPEHWVSVDDLPEALEREEKLLRQQEKILKEKILNEKLKRELNLDTIEERYCDYREAQRQQRYEEESISFKGHSLDTYELTEKKLRERGGNKNSSLDEHLLGEKSISGYLKMEAKGTNYQEGVNYIQCKVVNDVAEIDQFGDNDEELEEFFVVLDENLRIGKEEGEGEVVWEEEDSFAGRISNEEILMSVPEEFKDAEKDEGNVSPGKVEIRLSEVGGRTEESEREEEKRGSSFEREEGSVREDAREESKPDLGRLSPYGGSRRGSEEQRKPSLSEDTGRLSPYDNSSRRSSVDPRRLSASEEPGRLSPFNDSRRGSEDPRRLSTSEDSRKYSMSESVSEETRRRLSSTEETRRKRASLTKQCSVGAESLSDEIISGIQECSSSFEQDEEKDVFEPEVEKPEAKSHRLEIEVSEDTSNGIARSKSEEEEEATVGIGGGHLAPPTSERELSRETEDSVDYGEGDLKEMREAVKEKDISEGLICDHESLKSVPPKSGSSLEKSESSEGDELRYIDEKRGSTPEIIVGKSKESVAMSIVVVNEGISVLRRITENDQRMREAATETRSLPRKPEVPEKGSNEGRHTFPKSHSVAKPKPATPPKPVLDSVHRKLTKATVGLKGSSESSKETSNLLKSSLDSSQESDIDKLSDYSLISHVQSQIARRNLSDAGKCLRLDAYEVGEKENRKTSSEEDGFALGQRTSSEEREKTESSSFELKSSADEGKGGRGEKRTVPKSGMEARKREAGFGTSKEKRSPEQEKRDSGEDGSSSSSAPVYPKRELSSTWKPFLLESSGSSSLEEGWLPPDENAHLADEEETSSTSNNQQDDSYREDADYATGFGYPVLNMSSAEMMVGGYGSVYALSRTLSRISERSTSEQERSDLEDDITKPSSHSVSAEEESILSSDHQPSLSSDPPSPKESSSRIPDLPVDKPTESEEKRPYEPFPGVIPPPVPEDDWPSPPSSSSVADTPVVSHVETFYIEIHPEEARKVVVATEPPREEGSSSDENQTLQEESEFLHLSSENVSASTTTTTTQDGTVVFAVRPKTGRTGSFSEDASLVSSSERSASVAGARHRSGSSYGGAEEVSDRTKETGGKMRFKHEDQSPSRCPDPVVYVDQDGSKSRIGGKIKPLKLTSPTGKTFGFFETPISKVRSPTSQRKFIETGGGGSQQSPTSFSETASPKNYGRFFEGGRSGRSPTKGKANACTPYYSNVADSAEKSYFGRYDTGSLERTKIHSSRKCFSYYSVSRTVPHEGDSSNSDGGPAAPSPNTIPRASKKIKRRHRVAMDLVVRDGKIVAPPKTKATVVENSDSDRSSPREFRTREGGREGRRKHSDV